MKLLCRLWQLGWVTTAAEINNSGCGQCASDFPADADCRTGHYCTSLFRRMMLFKSWSIFAVGAHSPSPDFHPKIDIDSFWANQKYE
jgi:hypothetical protein